MKKTYTIYIIRHIVSGKAYVGATSLTLKKRCSLHRSEAKRGNLNSKLHEAIREYGWREFSEKVLATVYDATEADELEREYIKKYRSLWPIGFNLEGGGEYNCTVHPESRKKMSISGKGRTFSEEHRRKISIASLGNTKWLGKKHSKETIEKLVLANLGKNNPMFGKKLSEEHKRKISGKGRTHSEETKAKISQSNAGQVRSEETCRKISEARKRYHAALKEAKKLIKEVQ